MKEFNKLEKLLFSERDYNIYLARKKYNKKYKFIARDFNVSIEMVKTIIKDVELKRI